MNGAPNKRLPIPSHRAVRARRSATIIAASAWIAGDVLCKNVVAVRRPRVLHFKDDTPRAALAAS